MSARHGRSSAPSWYLFLGNAARGVANVEGFRRHVDGVARRPPRRVRLSLVCQASTHTLRLVLLPRSRAAPWCPVGRRSAPVSVMRASTSARPELGQTIACATRRWSGLACRSFSSSSPPMWVTPTCRNRDTNSPARRHRQWNWPWTYGAGTAGGLFSIRTCS